MSVRHWSIVLGLALGAVGAAARDTNDAVERERIANERAVAETRFAEERLACEKNFVVTSCVDDARRRQRATLDSLRHQEAVLDDAQRRQRAAKRMAAIRAKVGAEGARPPAPGAAMRPEAQLRRDPPRAGVPSRTASAPRAAASGPEAAAREQRARARFEGRQREAREHREAAQRRTAARQTSGKKAAPLPVPSAASAAAR